MDPARTSSVSEPSSSSAASASTSSPPAMYDEEAAERERTSQLHPENPTVFYNAQYQTTTTTAYEFYDTPGIYGEDTWSCIIVLLTFWFFVATTLILGVFGMVNLQLTPNSSVLINVNHWFVESIKVEQVNESNDSGPVLYGLYNTPVLDVVKIWSKNHTTIVPIGSYKEWIYVLNKGSQINISYSVNSSSELSVILIVAKGSENLDEWIADPTYPNSTLSWNVIKGNGFIQQSIPGSSTYYVAVGNLNSEEVQVSLNISVKSYLYNTSEAYYKCTVANRSCRLKLFFPDGNSAVLTSPYEQESSPDNWYVKISYGPRWITYIFGIGGMTFLMFFGLHFINKCQFRRLEQTVQYNAAGGSERAPLLTRKDSDLSSWGSSYDSVSDNEEELEEGLIAGPDGKPVKDGEYNANVRRLCAICFDAPRDCFFLPCGHCVSCFTCGTRIAEVAGTCPICRRNIKKVRMIFTV